MQPLISVIVPIYKVEEYLHECVDSILCQTYSNLEVLLVDDGSPDGCPQICDEYADADSRVKAIHKPNGGLSDARNAGLKAATGDYVLFIDSDDYWIDKQAIEKLVTVLVLHPESEIVFFGRTTFIGNSTYESNGLSANVINGEAKPQVLKTILQEADFVASACLKLLKHDVLTKNNIKFEIGILSEDWDWSIELYTKTRHFAALDENFYGNRKRKGSISQSFKPKHADDILYILDKWTNRLPKLELPKDEEEAYYGFLAYIYCCALGSLALLPKVEQKKYRRLFSIYRTLLSHNLNPKVAQVHRLYRLMGYNLTVAILGFFLTYRSKKLK